MESHRGRLDWICNPAMNNPRGFESLLHLNYTIFIHYIFNNFPLPSVRPATVRRVGRVAECTSPLTRQTVTSREFESLALHKHFRMKKYLLKILGVILLCGFISKPANLYNKGSTNIEQIPEFAISHILTAEAVYSACEFYGIIHPKIVVAQSILETGYYKSNICIKYNNIFGLYDSYQKDYFKFNYWWESVEAYRNKVQCKLGKNYCSEEEYYKFLEELPYATDPNYVSKLQKIISKCQTQNSKN